MSQEENKNNQATGGGTTNQATGGAESTGAGTTTGKQFVKGKMGSSSELNAFTLMQKYLGQVPTKEDIQNLTTTTNSALKKIDSNNAELLEKITATLANSGSENSGLQGQIETALSAIKIDNNKQGEKIIAAIAKIATENTKQGEKINEALTKIATDINNELTKQADSNAEFQKAIINKFEQMEELEQAKAKAKAEQQANKKPPTITQKAIWLTTGLAIGAATAIAIYIAIS